MDFLPVAINPLLTLLKRQLYQDYMVVHYMMAITEGVTQGQNIGNFIVKNIQTKKMSLAVKANF